MKTTLCLLLTVCSVSLLAKTPSEALLAQIS